MRFAVIRNTFIPALAALAILAPLGQSWAASASEPSVEVKGIRNGDLKNYRAMLAGLDAFESNRALAPNAPEVRFWLRPRSDVASLDTEGLTLTIRADSKSIPLALGPNLDFSVPRDATAEDENADMDLNKPKRNFRVHPDVRSPNVPAGMRRLGDLRLECRVLVDIGKKEIGVFYTLFINSLLLTTEWCNHEWLQMPTPTPYKLASATLLAGDQRIPLKIDENGRGYTPPLRDKQYADDTLIELRAAE
ncbi:MAG: hypothetical protein K0R43_313 [Pseudoduganella sp.]|jgi:hypothetical protein|nr:hypothetical protein [Pseudoduganella sp.]